MLGKPVVTIPGCPPNPYNFLATVVHFLTFGKLPELDKLGRPLFAYGRLIHENCERRAHFDAGRFAMEFGDEGHRQGYCLYKLGCKGPETYANCSTFWASAMPARTTGRWAAATRASAAPKRALASPSRSIKSPRCSTSRPLAVPAHRRRAGQGRHLRLGRRRGGGGRCRRRAGRDADAQPRPVVTPPRRPSVPRKRARQTTRPEPDHGHPAQISSKGCWREAPRPPPRLPWRHRPARVKPVRVRPKPWACSTTPRLCVGCKACVAACKTGQRQPGRVLHRSTSCGTRRSIPRAHLQPDQDVPQRHHGCQGQPRPTASPS
jgi:ferredoxin